MPMKSAKRGASTSAAEVTNVSPHGLWLLVDEAEHFLPFDKFPWFREATIAAVTNLQRPSPQHLHWPELDVDLHVESLSEPDRYPLVSKVKPPRRAVKKAAAKSGSTKRRS
jgi:hypothetical protein